MNTVWLTVGGLVLTASILFSYVEWKVHRKRKAMEFITIQERKQMQTLLLVAVTMLFSALIGLSTVLL